MDVGRLFCGAVRDYLNERKVLGDKIDFHEGRGWVSRTFVVAGEADTVSRIYRDLIARFPPTDERPAS